MKRLVLINIPHFLPHSYSIFSGLIFLGMLTCIVSDESVEKKPSLCLTYVSTSGWECGGGGGVHAIPQRVVVSLLNDLIYDIHILLK